MKSRRRIYYGVNSKRIIMIRIMIFLLLFLTIGYSLLNQSLLMNTNIEVAKLKVTVDAGQYLEHGTKRGKDCPAGSFCSGSTFSYNAEEDQGIISCAVGSFSNAKSGTCTACQGKTTTDVGQSSCNSECSNKDGVDTWKNAVWNNNNSLTDLCTIQSCKAGYTKEGNTCGANTYHVTLDNQDATTPGTTSIDVVYDSGIPTITVPTKKGYTFKGYYEIIEHEEPTPDEEILYIKADGTGAKDWDLISDATLVAKWEVITTTCRAGEYLPHDATSCSSCPEGSSCSGGDYPYHETEDQGSTLCPAGTYSTGGATTCSVCSGGASSEAGATSCNKSCSNAAHVKSWVNGCTISTCDTGYENKNNSCVARKFDVTLDNKSATTPGSTSVEVTYNAPVPSITVPAKTGYTFGGYYSEDNGSGTQYIKNDGTSAKDWDKTDLTKLYAKWTIISKTCSAGQYLAKGATSCSNCLAGSYCAGGTYSYKAGEDQGISKCAIGSYSAASSSSCTACTGLTTSGVGKTSCDTDCDNKANVSDWNPANWNNNNPTGLCSIKTCTVGYSLESNHCNASKYTITLDNKGATTPGSASVEVTYNEAVPNITVPVKTGYTFGGYYTEENGGGTQYIKADGKSAKNWNIPNETILFAKWTAKSVTVSAGQYLPKNSLTPTDCPAGSYCVGGTFDFNPTTDQGIVSCAVGSYSTSKKTACTVCSNGKTTSGTGKTSCDIDCSNKTGASEWNTSSWNNNTPTGICSIKSCSTGYTLSSNKCNANSLVFDNQTVSKDYNTSSQTANVTPATNGTGTYTYTKKSGDADITVSSAGVITIPAGKAVGSYSVVITAKDSNSNVSKDATYTITINKVAATLTCSNKTYNGSEQTACSCTGGTVGGTYKATYYSATSYTASCTPDSNHTAPSNKTWTMAKKAITITAKAQTVNYGTDISKTTSDVTVATLGSGDSLTAITLTPSTTDYTTNGTITPSAATIKKSSTDVTSNYTITYNTGVLKINKVAATLTCSNKTYNGSEQTACSCTGGTVGGTYKATNASDTAYTATCTGDGNHTNPSNKTWTMAKKAVTVTAASQSRAWNNSALTNSSCSAGSGQLVSGHVVACTMTSASTITTAGSVDNEINTVTIKNGSTDVTSNYNVTKAKGTLTITEATPTVSLTAKTEAQRTYTGSAIAANTATVSPNGGGAITYTYYTNNACSAGATTTAPTNVGTYYVKASVAAVTNKTKSASSSCVNHTIVKSNTTTTMSAVTKTYNGSSQAASGASAKLSSNNAAAPSAAFTYTYYNGDSCSGTALSGAPTYVGTYSVKATLTGTSNYNSSTSSCVKYTMNPKAITITAKAQTVNYGTDISKTTSDVTVATLGSGDSLTAITLTPSTTDYTTNGTITPSAATIKKSSTDVTSNYTITYNTGVLKINKVAATLTCSNKTYNGSEQTACSCTGGTVGGTYKATNASDTAYTATCTGDGNHTNPSNKTWTMAKKAVTVTAASQSRAWNNSALTNSTCSAGSGQLVSGHSVACTMTSASTITTAGSVDNEISTVTIKNGSTDVTSNYNVTKAKGTLTITEATPTVSLTAKTATYTGSAIAANTATVSPNSNPTITYTYYTNSDCSTKTGTTAATGAAASAGAAPKQVGQWYVKASAAAVTNKTKAASSSCVSHKINQKKATITLTDSSKALTFGTAGTNTYTYDGDGTVSCTSSDTSKVTCSVNTSNKKITVTPVAVTTSAVTITVKAGAGTNYSAADNKTFTVTVADGVAPTAEITSTATLKSASQTATLKCNDDVGVASYYWGTTAPTTSSSYTTITSTKTMSVTKTVNAAGTYYLSCKDAGGNVTSSAATKVYNSYTVNNMLQNVSGSTYTTTHYTQASTNTYVAPNGTTLTTTSIYTVPDGSNSGRYNGISIGAASTTAASVSKTNATLDANKVISVWFTRNVLNIRYKTNSGTVTASTQNSAGTETYTWTADSSGLVSRSINGATATTNITVVRYGTAYSNKDLLVNYNNGSYLNITKSGSVAPDGAEWICDSGCATANMTFDQDKVTLTPPSGGVSTDALCNAKNADCTVVVKVNWKTSAAIPTAANYCNSLTYTGAEQTLPKTAGTGYTWTAGTKMTNAGSQNVTATLSSGYAWSDRSTGTKTISCSIGKATPTITLSPTALSVDVGKTNTFTATVKSGAASGTVSGTLAVVSGTTANATVTPGSTTITSANNSAGVATTETVSGVKIGTSNVTVNFTPDTASAANYNSAAQKTIVATVQDTTAPTVTNIAGGTTLKATSQNLTLKCSDTVGVTSYYFGETNPTAASAVTTTTAADLTALTGSGLTKNVTKEGTYYLACKDAAGNFAKKSIVIRKYQVQNVLETIAASSNTTYTSANYATNGSAATYYVKDGTTLTLASIYSKPTGANAFKGFTTATVSTTAQTPSTTAPKVATNNTTVYYMWWTRLTYKVTVSKPTNGTIKAETVTQTGNSVTASTAAAELTVKYGDTVKATATPSTGYSLSSWSGGYVSGSTSPVTGAAVTAAKTITGTFADVTKPTCTITSTSTQKATSQTATLKCSDGVGVTSYYYGTSSSPAASDYVSTSADLTSLTGSSGLTKTINAAGTYYIFAKDAAGNISDAKSVVIRSYSVRNLLLNIAGTAGTYSTANYTQASSATYYAPNNTSLAISSIYTIPTGAAAGTVKGYNLAAASTTAASLTAASTNVTLNGNKTISIWFDRNTYKVTITKPVNGSIKAETVTQTGNSTTVAAGASANGSLTVRYGDTVKATATPNTGYSVTWSGGYVSGTTSPVTGAAVTAAKTITGTFADSTKPTCTITSTSNQKATSQTATLKCSDGVGVTSYYYGTSSSPAASDYVTTSADLTSLTGSSGLTKTINAAGTYYIFAKDAAGNISDAKSVVIRSYSVRNLLLNIAGTAGTYSTANYTQASSTTYYAPNNTSLAIASIYTVPTGAAAGTVKGYNLAAASTTAASLTATSTNVTLNGNKTISIWFDRNTYKVTVSKPTHGTIKAETVTQTGNSVTASTAAAELTVRYGDKVKATATPNTGYSVTWSGGYVSGTTSPVTGAAVTAAKTITGTFADVTPPVCTITSTSTQKATSQTATLKCSDGVGVTSYYYGTSSSPAASDYVTTSADLTSLTGSSGLTKTISAAGTYYVFAKDAAGHVSDVKSVVIRSYSVRNLLLNIAGTAGTYSTANYTQASSTTYYAPNNTSLAISSIYTVPTGATAGTVKGYNLAAASTTAASLTAASTNVTLNGNKTISIWFDRNTYKVTVSKPTNGTVKAETVTQTGNSVTASTAAAELTVRYGDKVKATATPNTGYSVTWSGGYVSGTTSPVTGAAVTAAKTITGTFADVTKPTPTISGGTTQKSTGQTLTLKCTDTVGVTAYYWGPTNPTSASAITTTTAADLTSLQGSGLSKTGVTNGTYYLGCKDAAGNFNVTSIIIRKYVVNNLLETIAGTTGTYTSANYTSASTGTYYIKDGTAITLTSAYTVPTGAAAGTFKGYSTGYSTTAASPSTTNPTVATNDTTTYYMWFNRNTYTVTVSKPTNGTIKAETVTKTGNSVTASTAAASLTVKYGDKVKATATPNTGYSVTWSGGYVSGTTSPVTGAAVTAAKTITGTFEDIPKPTCSITSTSTQKATSQTATLKCSDNVGVTSYYYGTSSSPAASDYVTTSADLTSLTGSSGLTKTISAAGTYYLFAKDAAGNISDAKSVVIRSYSVRNLLLNIAGTAGTYSTANYTQASSTTYYAPNNTSLAISSIYTIPTGAAAGTVKGYNLAAASTTAASLTATSTNVTLNGNKTISIWFDRNTYKVTVSKPTNGTIKAETVTQTGNSVTASTAAAELTVRYGDKVKATATPSSGCSFLEWSGGYVSGTTSPVTGAAVTAAKTITGTFEISSYNITYNSNGGTFGSSTTNTVKYNVTSGAVTKYSHTSNVDDTGLKSSNYGGGWTNANITGTDRGDTSKAHVVTIPGASSINVDIYYNGESTSYDWVSVWAGSHPEYTAASNYSSGVSGGTKLGGSQSGSYTINGNSLTNMGKSTFTIDGDTVTFGFKSDSSGYGQGYGYYAIVTGVGKKFTVNTGTYKEPTQTNKVFAGWNTKADGSGTSISNDSELSKLTSATATLYAQYRDPTATFTTGQEFNATIKQLAGTASATYSTSDSNIKKFQKYTGTVNQTLLNNATIVSSADSENVIYAWFSSGTIYWYTTSSIIYFNSDSSYMFNNITNLATLDLSKFDFSKVSSSSSMFSSTTALNTIVTPKVNSSSSISLGKTFVNQSNTTYSSLTSSTPTNTTIKVPYTITFDINGGKNSSCTATAKTKQIYPGNKLGTIPEISATKFGYAQGGWCSDSECNNVINLTENTVPPSSITYYIYWTKDGVWAENVSYSHSGISCSDTQCLLDYLANQYKEKRVSVNGS